MQNPFETWYKTPKTYERIVSSEETIDSVRTITVVTEDKLKDKDLRIPISPYIHPKGLQDLLAEADKASFSTAMMLLTGLHSRSQKNIVECSIDQLAKVNNNSTRTTITSLGKLVELGYITKVGKQSYEISAKLAWFGNQVEWAKALKQLSGA